MFLTMGNLECRRFIDPRSSHNDILDLPDSRNNYISSSFLLLFSQNRSLQKTSGDPSFFIASKPEIN